MIFWKQKKETPVAQKDPVQKNTNPTIKNIIAIASGKGGVGKSTVATNLAIALSKTGNKVGLLDADIYGPSQPAMLGVSNQIPETTEDRQLIPTFSHGVHFVSMGLVTRGDGPVIWRAPIAVKMIQQFLSNVKWGELDYLLIDLPPGTGDVQLTLAQRASLTGAVIVSTPQNVALDISKKGLRMFQKVNVPILGIVENMSGFTCEHCGKETHIFKQGGGTKMARELEVPLLGKIPLDPKIMMGGEEGVPVVIKDKESISAKAYLDLADALCQEIKKTKKETTEEPEQIKILDKKLQITWPDGHKSIHSPYNMRVNCACAICVDENSRIRILDTSKIPLDIQFKNFNKVGRYALGLHFSDNHNSGIYTFARLKAICECDSCNAKNKKEKESFSV